MTHQRNSVNGCMSCEGQSRDALRINQKGRQMEKLYLSAREAAEYVGIGINAMHDILNARDHPPYLVIGNAKRVRKDALREYFEKREIK